MSALATHITSTDETATTTTTTTTSTAITTTAAAIKLLLLKLLRLLLLCLISPSTEFADMTDPTTCSFIRADVQAVMPQENMGYNGIDVAGSCGVNGSLFSSTASGLEAPAATPPPYQVLNIRYDLTSMRNVSAVITEVGLIPPTSIPVLIRELRLDQR